MSHDEMRFLRRDLISNRLQYWQEWARFFNYSYGKLTFVKNMVRSSERAYYSQELKAYA